MTGRVEKEPIVGLGEPYSGYNHKQGQFGRKKEVSLCVKNKLFKSRRGKGND